MKTTVQSLKKLGKKLNGADPTGSTISTVIDGIADGYSGGQANVGVTSIGGVDGAITLGDNLSMNGQQLQVSVSGGGVTAINLGTINVEQDDNITSYAVYKGTAESLSTINIATLDSIISNPQNYQIYFEANGAGIDGTKIIENIGYTMNMGGEYKAVFGGNYLVTPVSDSNTDCTLIGSSLELVCEDGSNINASVAFYQGCIPMFYNGN